MRHVYACQTRWADLDQLGHVNNVTYVDYLQEARVDLMRDLAGSSASSASAGSDGAPEPGVGIVVARHQVTYLSPMGLRFRPVTVTSRVVDVRASSFTLDHEIFHDDDPGGGGDDGAGGGRTVYVRARSVLAPFDFAQEIPRRIGRSERAALLRYAEGDGVEPVPATPRVAPVDRSRAVAWPLQVRFSDVDSFRHVNNVTYFEYFQESRIRMMAELTRGLDEGRPHFVVAQTDVEYLQPILQRPEPYQVWSEPVRLGGRSLTVESEIADGDRVLARARVTMVFWDPATGRSTDPSPQARERLAASVGRR